MSVGARRAIRRCMKGKTLQTANFRAKKGSVIKLLTGALSTAAPVGSIGYNVADNNAYICTVASGTWVKLNA